MQEHETWFGVVPDDDGTDPTDPRGFEVARDGAVTAENVDASVAAMKQADRDAAAWTAWLESLGGEAALKRATVVEYRAKHPRGDLLARVIRTEQGELVLLTPPFTLPPTMQADTHPVARRERTQDGERRWCRRTTLVPSMRWPEVTLRSSHYSCTVTVGRLIDDAAARPTRPIIL